MGWNIHQEHIILEDWTGKDLQRPGLLRLLELARAGKIQGVIIYTLDRLYRPENDGDEWRVFEVLQQFQDAGVEVAWVDTSIPARGPLSSIFTFLDTWRAGRERRAIIERTSRGLLEKARRGKVISRAAAPYGYRFDPETSTLVLQEDEAKIVRIVRQPGDGGAGVGNGLGKGVFRHQAIVDGHPGNPACIPFRGRE